MASTVVLLAAALALGQPMTEAEILARIGLPGESSQSARRLLTADQLAAQKKWAEAVEHYERIIREGGDDLVPVDAYRSLQARWLCHRRLADLPAEALRLYRSHVDNQAKRWLDQGTAAHDPQILRRLPDEAFCSRFTDQALDLLGDLAFERGAFDEAEHWWRLLALPASAKDRPENRDQLIFPDPRVDGARIRAKQLLALLFRGQPAAADKEWQAFRQLHAEAAGELAGRNGNYAEIVHDLITREGTDSGTNAPENWTSFAGDPTRNFLVAGGQQSLARLSGLDRPTWDVPLHPVAREDPPSQAGEHPLRDSRALAYFPLIVGNQALVSDARYVRGYELTTGRLTLEYNVQPDASDEELGITLPPDRPVLRQPSRAAFPADLAYTLTADGERVYARLGAQGISAGKEKAAPSFLVCLDLHWADSGALLRWKVKATASGNSPAFFEGSPVAHAGSVYGAVTRLAGIETITAIACYDADTGSLQWQREVCSTQELRDGDRRYQHQLVTLAGPNIVYCSHSGAIVALDAPTGRRVWGVRYPSRGSKTAEGDLSPRSLAPCLYDGQRLYVAPTDYDRILCLDASTGRQLWESASLEVVHLLGVAQGRIIFSSTTPRACIRALDASDGNDVPGWLFPWAAKLTPCGRPGSKAAASACSIRPAASLSRLPGASAATWPPLAAAWSLRTGTPFRPIFPKACCCRAGGPRPAHPAILPWIATAWRWPRPARDGQSRRSPIFRSSSAPPGQEFVIRESHCQSWPGRDGIAAFSRPRPGQPGRNSGMQPTSFSLRRPAQHFL